MNELKYCKFCDKEKPIKDFVKSGFATKNICKECQNKKQTQIYKNSKKVKELQQENKQLKDNWNELKEYLEKTIVDSKSCGAQQYYYEQVYKFVIELEEGSDSNE